jgi:hypothetical protein
MNLRSAQNHPTYDCAAAIWKTARFIEVIAKLPKGMFLRMETRPNPSFPRRGNDMQTQVPQQAATVSLFCNYLYNKKIL